MIKGIDVSHHNGTINWAAVKAGGIDFAVIRAGYGRTADTRFTQNITGAQKAGTAVGIYWFSYALNPAEAAAEADFCRGLLAPYKIGLPVYYDFEYDTETYAKKKGVLYTKDSRTAIIAAFCERIKGYGYAPGVYINPDYITARTDWAKLKKYSLWLAQWPLGADRNISFAEVKDSAVSAAYGKPDIWQIGRGSVAGIPADTDLNYGYTALPTISASAPTPAPAAIKKGDKVKIKYTVISGGIKRGNLYGGGTFVVYSDSYDVISVSGGRAVIGRGNAVTAAVKVADLELIK